ncbi:MAG TPA: NmrA/HSCARG family protein, partial [Polyangiaceae bacterium]
MAILVTGSTGTVGRQVVAQLVKRGASVRALARDPAKANHPTEVEVVPGDLLDVDSLRGALTGASSLFLLNAVAADEFTQALVALNMARQVGIQRIVYLSVIHSDRYVNVPHFAGKFGVERMLEQMGFNATILRPAYFMNNDLTIKDVILKYGVYPMPIGGKGLAMIDARDIGEIAALELLRREQSAEPLPLERINLVGPDTLTGASVASIWSEVLG